MAGAVANFGVNAEADALSLNSRAFGLRPFLAGAGVVEVDVGVVVVVVVAAADDSDFAVGGLAVCSDSLVGAVTFLSDLIASGFLSDDAEAGLAAAFASFFEAEGDVAFFGEDVGAAAFSAGCGFGDAVTGFRSGCCLADCLAPAGAGVAVVGAAGGCTGVGFAADRPRTASLNENGFGAGAALDEGAVAGCAATGAVFGAGVLTFAGVAAGTATGGGV